MCDPHLADASRQSQRRILQAPATACHLLLTVIRSPFCLGGSADDKAASRGHLHITCRVSSLVVTFDGAHYQHVLTLGVTGRFGNHHLSTQLPPLRCQRWTPGRYEVRHCFVCFFSRLSNSLVRLHPSCCPPPPSSMAHASVRQPEAL